MGTIRHNAIVCTTGIEKVSKIAYRKATEIFGDKVTNVVEGVINQYYSFMVAPDGSKEGWTESDNWDDKRDKFIQWIETYTLNELGEDYGFDEISIYLDYVEISFGGDAGGAHVVRASE